MHDQLALELRGTPAVFIATTEFIDAANAQARALGGDPAAVYVPHPIQDRTDAELVEIADRAVDAVLASLVEGGGADEGSG